MIRLSRRRRPRVHIIEHDIAGRTVRDASCSASREDAVAPMAVLTCSRPGGHHERHPLARNLNGPPLTRKATLEIYTVARSSQDLPPGVSRHPRGWFQTSPGYRTPPGGVCKHPRGGCSRPCGYATTPGALRHYPGVTVVMRRGPRCPRRGTCGARPQPRPDAASAADTTTLRSRP